MATPMQIYGISVLFSAASICAFLLCVAVGMRGYKLWTTRRFYVKDFHRLSTEATALTLETENIREEVEQAITTEPPVRVFPNMKMLASADEWDTSIRIALAAWEDIMRPEESAGDLESGKGDGTGRKRHGRYVAGLMRAKCMEGIERRKELGPHLQKLLHDVQAVSSQRPEPRLSPKPRDNVRET